MRLAGALAAMARELPVKVVWPKLEPKIERWLEDQEADIGLEAYRTAWRDWVIGEVTEGINPHPVAFAKHMQRGRSYSKGNASRVRGNGYEKREPPQDESHLPTPDDQMWINKGLPVNAKERAKVMAKRFKEDRTPEKLKQMWDIVNRAREKSKATKL
jgi:hypothetical protein